MFALLFGAFFVISCLGFMISLLGFVIHILAIGSVVLGVFEYLLASDKADQIKGLLLIILAAVIM